MAKHTSETPENEIQNRFSSENVEGFGAVIYYISIIVIFLFLTTRVLEKRRWS